MSMKQKLRVAITGAAGNLGNLLAEGLLTEDVIQNLLIHHKDVNAKFKDKEDIHIFPIDLANKASLGEALEQVDVVVHFAGVLFKANPEKFLPKTNTQYFKNLLSAAVEKQVKRIILISFPHVEGETSPQNPARGILDGKPISMHAQTRLEEEKLLFDYNIKSNIETISLRVGMVYGAGILMIDAAQWFARHKLLGIWKKDTYIHLISKTDFVACTIAAIKLPNISGIYHIGDEGIQTLQTFLDDITRYKSNTPPWRMPVWMIMMPARCFEFFSLVFKTKSPLTVDFIKIGMVSYYGDTSRMREELSPTLKYRTYKEGIELF